MNLFLQLLLNGIVAGSLYSLMAISLSLIYGATRHFHIAHAAVFSAAGYLTYVFGTALGLPAGLAVPIAILAATGLGVAIVRLLYRPLEERGGGPFIIFLVSLGTLAVVVNVFTLWLGQSPVRVTFAQGLRRPVEFGGLSLTVVQIGLILVSILCLGLLFYLLNCTWWGKYIRAFSSNPEFVEIIGGNPRALEILVYSIGSAIAALAGIYAAFDTGMTPGLGEEYFIIAILAVILGGVGSVSGAFAAAMLLGVLQNVLQLGVPAEWTVPIVFALFLLIISVSPSGLASLSFRSLRSER